MVTVTFPSLGCLIKVLKILCTECSQVTCVKVLLGQVRVLGIIMQHSLFIYEVSH